MQLDDDELRATRRANGAETQILIDIKDIDNKIEDLKDWLKTKNPDEDAYYLLQGKIDALIAIKEGKLTYLS